MTTAAGRRLFDADSHVLEPTDWLAPYADPAVRGRLQALALPFAPDNAAAAEIVARRTDRSVADIVAGGKLWGRGYDAYGAWDSTERAAILDTFAIDAQLVFSTFAADQFMSPDLDLLYGGIRAHTRALAEFCAGDPRLLAVPLISLADVERAVEELDFALALGPGAILLPSTAPSKTMGPGHPALDAVWARLQDAGVPFVTHVGSGGRLVPRGYRENGRPLPPDFLGGGENIRSKDFINIGYWPENFLSCLALDGVFERFPGLRGASIEQGAEWVPGMLKKLDGAMQFARTEPDLAALPLKASDYIRRQVKFAPFAKDDVGWVIDNVGPDLLMFSTDFPHPEGTRDPIGRFETHLERFDESVRQRFYVENLAELLGPALSTSVPAAASSPAPSPGSASSVGPD
ncbi:MAG: amidohydrolase family protein [Acidimicrobiales bacterium]|jgi:predicted TIM-barrel fold metal-dependent hydrolase